MPSGIKTKIGDPITKQQSKVLAFIEKFTARNGFAPTVREIATAFKWCGPNAAVNHLVALCKKGRLSWIRHKARTLRVLKPSTI